VGAALTAGAALQEARADLEAALFPGPDAASCRRLVPALERPELARRAASERP